MTGFPEARLGDHVDLLAGYAFKSGSFTDDPGDVRLVRGDNIGHGRLRWDRCRRWPAEDQSVANYTLREGDVVVAMDRPWIDSGLKFAAVRAEDLPALLVQRVARLRSRESLDQVFLRYAISSSSFATHVQMVQTGTAVPHISGRSIQDFEFPLPALGEQRRIAGLLGTLDDKIDLDQRIAAVSEGLAVAALAARLDDAEWSTLGELASHHKQAVEPSSLGDQEVDHFSIPAFDSGRRPVRESASSIKSGKLRVQQGDVLVSRLNPRIPRVWLARTDADVPAMCSTEFLVLRPADPEVTAGLIFAAVSQPEVSSDMTQRASGTSGSHQRIKPADAMAVAVPVVKNAALSGLLDDLVGTASQARQEAASLAELRDALLPKLLSGELRVREAEEAVEDVA